MTVSVSTIYERMCHKPQLGASMHNLPASAPPQPPNLLLSCPPRAHPSPIHAHMHARTHAHTQAPTPPAHIYKHISSTR